MVQVQYIIVQLRLLIDKVIYKRGHKLGALGFDSGCMSDCPSDGPSTGSTEF